MHQAAIFTRIPRLDKCSPPSACLLANGVKTQLWGSQAPSPFISCHCSISGLQSSQTMLFPPEPPSKMSSHKVKKSHCPKASELQAGRWDGVGPLLCLFHWRKHPTVPLTKESKNGQASAQARRSCDEGRSRDREQGGRPRGEKKMAKALFLPVSSSN